MDSALDRKEVKRIRGDDFKKKGGQDTENPAFVLAPIQAKNK